MAKTYVITGGTCAGKTSLINHFSELGFHTVPECARGFIEQQMQMGGTHLPWVDFMNFQKSIFKIQTDAENSLPNHDKPVFMDRAVPDGLAFFKIRGLTPFDELIKASQDKPYSKVFMLDLIPTYEEDGIRTETKEDSQKLHELLREVYTDLGHKVIDVPFVPLVERAKFILKKLDLDHP